MDERITFLVSSQLLEDLDTFIQQSPIYSDRSAFLRAILVKALKEEKQPDPTAAEPS